MKWIRMLYTAIIIGTFRYRKNLFYKLVVLCCLSICIPVLITGTIYYQLATSKAEVQAVDHSLSDLTHIKDGIEELLHNVEQDSFQLTLDPALAEAFKRPGFEENYFVQKSIIEKLSTIRNFSRLAGEIIFLRPGDNFVLSSELGNVQKDRFQFSGDINFILQKNKLASWEQLPAGANKGYLTFWRRFPESVDEANKGYLIYQVKIDTLQKYLQAMSVKYSSLYVLDSQNLSLLEKPGSLPIDLTNLRAKNFFSGLDPMSSSNNGSRYLYTYIKTALGRTYISVIPREEITNEFFWIRWLLALVVVTVVSLSIGMSVMHLRRIYSPIEQLIKYGQALRPGKEGGNAGNEVSFLKECLEYLQNETRKINDYVLRIEPTVRERFLQMVLEWSPLIRHSLNDDCKMHHIDTNGTYAVLMAEIENMHKENRFLKGDEPLVSFAIVNIMNELLQLGHSPLKGYVLISHEGKATAIVHPGEEMSMSVFLQHIHHFAVNVTGSMAEIMKIKGSIGIGNIYTHIADISMSYYEAKVALKQRIYGKSKDVLFIGDGDKLQKRSSSQYPYYIETKIIEALKTDDRIKARGEFLLFSREICLSGESGFIYQCYQMLLTSLLKAFQMEGGNLQLLLSEHALFEELRERQTSLELEDWFTERFFTLYLSVLHQDKSGKTKFAVNQICRYINEHVLEGLSLIQCSELVGMSPSYISLVFKKEKGMNFVEYVAFCKLEESKKMLIQTSMNINEIASTIGFSGRHFIRVFQKYNGTSPSQFRATHHSKS